MKNRKIVHYVTAQYMKRNKKRTVTTLIGIMFMVMLMTCVFVGKDTAISYLTKLAESKSGSWHVSLLGIDKEQYIKVKELDFIEKTALSSDYGFSEIPENLRKSNKENNKPYFEIKAYSPECFDMMNIKVIKGRLPENENEILLSKIALDDLDLSIGDSLHAGMFFRYIKGVDSHSESTYFPYQGITVKYGETISVPQDFPYYGKNDAFEEIKDYTGRVTDYKIVGFIEEPIYETVTGSFYAAITYISNDETAFAKVNNKAGDKKGETINLSLITDLKNYDSEDYDQLKNIMGVDETMYSFKDIIDTNDLLLVFSGDSSESSINTISAGLVLFFVVFIVLVSVALIYNVFNISFEERKKYLGLLSSVGATRRQKMSSVYYEAFVLLLFALPIGFILGLVIVKCGMLVIGPHIYKMLSSFEAGRVGNAAIHLVITPANVVLVLLVSIFTVLVSSVIPAKKIGKIGPIKSIRGGETVKKRRLRESRHLLRKGRVGVLLALRNLKMAKQKSESIIRAIAVFLIVLIVTTFVMNAVTKMVKYRLIDDATISFNNIGYDYELNETEGYGSAYGALKKDILSDEDVAETKEWYLDMFGGMFDGNLLNDNYWSAIRAIVRENYGKGLSDQECMKIIMGNNKKSNEKPVTISMVGVDNKAFYDIAKKCGCDLNLLKSVKNPMIFYQDIELSTDNMRYEGKTPANYRMFDLNDICALAAGDKLKVHMYNPNTDKNEDYLFTLFGYAHKNDVKDYLSFNGEQIWIITNEDTARQMREIYSKNNDSDSDGNYNTFDRTLFIKLKNADSDISKKLQYLSTKENEEYIVVAKDSGKYKLANAAEAINYTIRILAFCFVVFSGVICLINLYNSIRGRAILRRRDIAVLRSLGMEDKQLDKMFLLENVCMWLKGLAVSLIVSIPLTYAIKRFLMNYFGMMKLAFPWYLYLVSATVTIIFLLIISKICYHMKEDEILIEEMRI